ncbi:MAG TPA: hypothetical protein VNO30_43260 [Kofleriaceae bacterium]|nr:hypothetical protein [Kofleriaceae bacterium]
MTLTQNVSSLHASTLDPGAASTEPVTRPKPGGALLRWYQDAKPRFYRPYLIRVLRRDDTSMEFVFLDGRTGEDLALSKRSYQISYHDGRYAHSALPSTAQKVQPGSARSCGLLFMSDLYIQSLPQADGAALLSSGNDDDKWPRSAGREAPPSPRPSPRPQPKAAPKRARAASPKRARAAAARAPQRTRAAKPAKKPRRS